jgi:hypothetical protein
VWFVVYRVALVITQDYAGIRSAVQRVMGYYDDASKNAIGATLLKFDANDSQVTLYTDKGVLTLRAEGDCCSHSWFESTDDFGSIGGQITEFDFGTTEDLGEVSNYEFVIVYFPVVKTTKGRLCMEMRNSSNGYYGGYIQAEWKAL